MFQHAVLNQAKKQDLTLCGSSVDLHGRCLVLFVARTCMDNYGCVYYIRVYVCVYIYIYVLIRIDYNDNNNNNNNDNNMCMCVYM